MGWVTGDRSRPQGMLNAMGILSAEPARHTTELDWCVQLRSGTRAAGEAWVESTSRLSDLQLAVEVGLTDRKRKALEEDTRLTRLRVAGVRAKPVERKGKRYNRLEVLGDENGQKKAEAKLHNRC